MAKRGKSLAYIIPRLNSQTRENEVPGALILNNNEFRPETPPPFSHDPQNAKDTHGRNVSIEPGTDNGRSPKYRRRKRPDMSRTCQKLSITLRGSTPPFAAEGATRRPKPCNYGDRPGFPFRVQPGHEGTPGDLYLPILPRGRWGSQGRPPRSKDRGNAIRRPAVRSIHSFTYPPFMIRRHVPSPSLALLKFMHIRPRQRFIFTYPNLSGLFPSSSRVRTSLSFSLSHSCLRLLSFSLSLSFTLYSLSLSLSPSPIFHSLSILFLYFFLSVSLLFPPFSILLFSLLSYMPYLFHFLLPSRLFAHSPPYLSISPFSSSSSTSSSPSPPLSPFPLPLLLIFPLSPIPLSFFRFSLSLSLFSFLFLSFHCPFSPLSLSPFIPPFPFPCLPFPSLSSTSFSSSLFSLPFPFSSSLYLPIPSLPFPPSSLSQSLLGLRLSSRLFSFLLNSLNLSRSLLPRSISPISLIYVSIKDTRQTQPTLIPSSYDVSASNPIRLTTARTGPPDSEQTAPLHSASSRELRVLCLSGELGSGEAAPVAGIQLLCSRSLSGEMRSRGAEAF
ncbi:hypothetical protein C7M84_024332 [Penaeus vannamei]|uniref:Uncharacterized protein n=1 Tax=Penaeus vannamei TaxID=6689 RepID=A0A3R7NBD9_PENVA|nr:hypothetical protein C7M84_024332 [Penaeus vannamei]